MKELVDLEKKVTEVLEYLGIDPALEISDQIDSASFVSMVVEIEQEFSIEIPDELLNRESLKDLKSIVQVITSNR